MESQQHVARRVGRLRTGGGVPVQRAVSSGIHRLRFGRRAAGRMAWREVRGAVRFAGAAAHHRVSHDRVFALHFILGAVRQRSVVAPVPRVGARHALDSVRVRFERPGNPGEMVGPH